MTKVRVPSVYLGQMELLVVCVLVQVISVTLAYGYDPSLASLPFRDFNKEFDLSSQDNWDAFNQITDELPDNTLLDGQKRLADSNDVFGDVSGGTRNRQLQHELRYLVRQLEKLHHTDRQNVNNLSDMKQSGKPHKRQSGAQICIWKVCPPSPWRRSGGKY